MNDVHMEFMRAVIGTMYINHKVAGHRFACTAARSGDTDYGWDISKTDFTCKCKHCGRTVAEGKHGFIAPTDFLPNGAASHLGLTPAQGS